MPPTIPDSCLDSIPSQDVLTFGEAMLRLSPPGRARVEQAQTLDVHVAGTESNVAIALARLGLRASWVSRLPDDGRGRRVASSLAAHGVDISHIRWLPADSGARVGVFFVEYGAAPRPTSVIYDRAGAAICDLETGDLPDELLRCHRHLHVTGITPALSGGCADVVDGVVRRARALGRTVSLDVNYRARLWSPAAAAEALTPLLDSVDLLITSAEDARLLWDAPGEGEEIARHLRQRFGVASVAVTLAGGGAIALHGDTLAAAEPYAVEMVDRLGAGDAFAAGLLCGYLEEGNLTRGVRLGMAMASLKLTIPGDAFFFTRAEVEALADGAVTGALRR